MSAPTVFLSAVTKDFGPILDELQAAITKELDCFCRYRNNLKPGGTLLPDKLRSEIIEADAVIHLVGPSFGFGPDDVLDPAVQRTPAGEYWKPMCKSWWPFPDAFPARRSYTQMEYDFATELKRPTWVIFVDDTALIAAATQPGNEAACQAEHRRAIKARGHEYVSTESVATVADIIKALPVIVSELKKKIVVQADHIAITNQRLGSIESNLESALASVGSVSLYLANLTRRYATHNTFGLPAFEAPGQKQEADRIEEIFVQPTCTPGRTSPEAMEGALREGKNPAAALLPVLEKERRVVLLADPGMGKSTLVQWLVVALAAPVPSREAARFGRAIPFPILLRDIVPALGNDLSKWTWQALMDAFLAHKAGGSEKDKALAAPLADDSAMLRTVLESPQAWFLLDGLEEIGDPKRRLALQKVIWEGFELYPNARWLVTSRVVGYYEAIIDWRFDDAVLHEELKANEKLYSTILLLMTANGLIQPGSEVGELTSLADAFRVLAAKGNELENHHFSRALESCMVECATLLHLAPWDDTQQRDFADHWFTQRLGQSKGGELAREFITDVRAHSSTRVLGRVPNLLLLMGLLYRYRAHLPNGRALVYQGISAAYLEGIEIHRKTPHRMAVPYTFAEKERLLAIIAMHMMMKRMVVSKSRTVDQENVSEILVSAEDLSTWLGPEFSADADKVNARELTDFLKHIADSSGLLLERQLGVFGFAHLSFQEYYAACYLKLEFERLIASRGRARKAAASTCVTLDPLQEEDFEKWAALPVWREPLLFLVELLKGSEPFTAEVMAWLFPSVLAEPPVVPESIHAQRLLATLSIDPEAAVATAERQSMWAVLCEAHLQSRHAWSAIDSIAPALLERSEHQAEVLRTLVSLAAQRKAKRLSLVGCTGVSDLTALQGLGSLQQLDLTGCTGVGDLDALMDLGSLLTLNLFGCTGVSDLTALKGLGNLQKLDLTGCTGVRDLAALKDLGNLQELLCFGCTGVKDQKRQYAELNNALPKCGIYY